MQNSRRTFLQGVGQAMLVAGAGAATAFDLQLAHAESADREDGEGRVTFGDLEPLVSLMQETPPERLLPQLVSRLGQGESLARLTSAAALANVRAFAGQDYTGYHTFMALNPALHMAAELPAERKPLPVMKVLYRNSSRIQQQGAATRDALGELAENQAKRHGKPTAIRDAVRRLDRTAAEHHLASAAEQSPGEAFQHLQFAVREEVDVHRVVLSWRCWSMIDLTGSVFAEPLLRQSVRYCLNVEQRLQSAGRQPSPIRTLLPKLMDQYGLMGPRATGEVREADDAWVRGLAETIYSGSRAEAAEAVAAALAEGFSGEAIGEAMSLAATRLVLHDPGRRPENSSATKPAGCVHGDSVGVHASDAANAWRNISRVGSDRNRAASLIVGAFHTAGQTRWNTKTPFPYAEQLEPLRAIAEPNALLDRLHEAIRGNDQARACAIADRYGQLQAPSEPLMRVLLQYAVSQDGALHAEKYYRTVTEEFAATRPSLRQPYLVALARVTASEYGFPAPGHQQACELLNINAS